MSHFELGSPWLAKKKLFRKLAVMPHLVHLGLPPDVSHFSTVTLNVELYKSIMHKRAQIQAILTLNYVVRMSLIVSMISLKRRLLICLKEGVFSPLFSCRSGLRDPNNQVTPYHFLNVQSAPWWKDLEVLRSIKLPNKVGRVSPKLVFLEIPDCKCLRYILLKLSILMIIMSSDC